MCVLIKGHDDNVVDYGNEEDDDDDDDDEEDDEDDDENGEEVGLEYLQKPGEELEVSGRVNAGVGGRIVLLL